MVDIRNDLYALIDRVYDAIDDSSAWDDVVERVRTRVGSATVVLACRAGDSAFNSRVICRGSLQARIAADPDAYLRSEPLLRDELWESYSDRGIISNKQVVMGRRQGSSAWFHSHWLEPAGITHAYAIGLCVGNGVTAVLLIYMASRELERTDADFIEGLQPHLQRVVCLTHRIRLNAAQEARYLQILNRIRLGVILMDGDAAPIFINRTMAKILEQRTSIDVTAQGVQFTNNPRESQDIRQTVRLLLAQIGSGIAPEVKTVRLCPDLGASYVSVVLVPLIGSSVVGEANAARLAMLVNDPAYCDCIDPVYLTTHYAMTNAEAEVATSLVAGESAKQLAVNRGVSLPTIRAQIRSVMKKMDVRRQADVIRILVSDCIVQG